jgi:hypothetical protein
MRSYRPLEVQLAFAAERFPRPVIAKASVLVMPAAMPILDHHALAGEYLAQAQPADMDSHLAWSLHQCDHPSNLSANIAIPMHPITVATPARPCFGDSSGQSSM